MIYCDDGQRRGQIKDLCELYVWWLGNSKYKACLPACGSEGHFVPSECTVASTKAVHCRVYCWNCNAEQLPKKYLVFKICSSNITHTQSVQRFNWYFTNTEFILLSSESFSQNVRMHKSLYLKTVNVYKQYMSKQSTSKLQMS